MYELVEGQCAKLFKEGKENTPSGINFKEEMDYWWGTLSFNQRKTLMAKAKKQLEDAFTPKFGEFYPDKKEEQHECS